jgi:transcriptional regulator with XRE-family HTH domain
MEQANHHPFRIYRQTRELTVERAAEELGVSKATVSRIENGKQELSADLIRRIHDWSGGAVTANHLLGIIPLQPATVAAAPSPEAA